MAAFVHGAEAEARPQAQQQQRAGIRSAQGKRASPQIRPAHEDQAPWPATVASQPHLLADSAGAGRSTGISSLGGVG